MELVVVSGEREERLRIVRSGECYDVRVGEREYRIDAAALHPLLSLLVDGRQAELVIRRAAPDRYSVSGANGETELLVQDPLRRMAEIGRGGDRVRGGRKVEAYMPGRVVTLLVEEGAEVAAGQGILVLEAMKMENEIRSDWAGVLRRVFVEPGQAVEGGDPLFEVE